MRKTDAEIKAQALAIWQTLDANERHGIAFGLFPADKMGALTTANRDEAQRVSVALMEIEKTK